MVRLVGVMGYPEGVVVESGGEVFLVISLIAVDDRFGTYFFLYKLGETQYAVFEVDNIIWGGA